MRRRHHFAIDFSHLLGGPYKPVGTTCLPQVAALVHRILNWEPVTIASLISEGIEEGEARNLLGQATALVLKNHGRNIALAARLLALAGEGSGGASAAAARAFDTIQSSAMWDSDRLDLVRERFADQAKEKA